MTTLFPGSNITPEQVEPQFYKSHKIVITKGGSGSGNFGHAGRPGLIGGSAEENGKLAKRPVPMFHGTSTEAAEYIKKEGLTVQSDTVSNRPDSVYFTTDKAVAIGYGQMAGLGEFVIIEFEIPSQYSDKVKQDEWDAKYGQTDDYRMESNVPPEWIKSIHIYDKGEHVPGGYNSKLRQTITMNKEQKRYYATLIIKARQGISQVESKNVNLSINNPQIGHKKRVVMKGGEGSGNFGHAGRPGLLGGSAPGKDAAYYDDFVRSKMVGNNSLEDFYKLYAELVPGAKLSLGQLLEQAYEYKDAESGLTSKIDGIQIQTYDNGLPTTITIDGRILNKDGFYAGTFIRKIGPDATADHELLSIIDNAQNTGFGSRFYQNSEDAYVAAGIKNIELFADLEVGGYVWARMGFECSFKTDFIQFKAKVMEMYLQHSYEPDKADWMDKIIGPMTHMYELAAATTPDGTRVGKLVLLASDWMGHKSLDPNNIGYIMGKLYTQSKAGKKGRK